MHACVRGPGGCLPPLRWLLTLSCRSQMQISTILGVAVPAEREDSAWSEGVAIWVAVLVVSLVGEWAGLRLAGMLAQPVSAGLDVHRQMRSACMRACWSGVDLRTFMLRVFKLPYLTVRLLTPALLPPGAFNDWNKDRQFQKLNAQKDIIEVCACWGVLASGGPQAYPILSGAAWMPCSPPARPAVPACILVNNQHVEDAQACTPHCARRPPAGQGDPRRPAADGAQLRGGGGRPHAAGHGRQDHRRRLRCGGAPSPLVGVWFVCKAFKLGHTV